MLVKKYKFLFFILIIFVIESCSPVKLVSENQFLLKKVEIECKNKEIETSDLGNCVKQRPNSKILFVYRFYLQVYNTFYSRKDKGRISKWLVETIGEPPVVVDDDLSRKSSEQMKRFLRGRGYYFSKVRDTMIQNGYKRAKVKYFVETNEPFVVDTINFGIQNAEIQKLIYKDISNSLLKKGMLLDAGVLEQERDRISQLLRSKGFFRFGKDFVIYKVDTNVFSKKANLTVDIKPAIVTINGKTQAAEHKKYKINEIYVFPAFDPKTSLEQQHYFENLQTDTVKPFIFKGKNLGKVKDVALTRGIYIQRNNLYNGQNQTDTYKYLSSLRIYKNVSILYNEFPPPQRDSVDYGWLDCYVQLAPAVRQAFSVELEGTNSEGNIGFAASFVYQHKNIFRRAEVFDFKFKTALQQQKTIFESNSKFFNTKEYSTEIKVTFPKLLTPLKPLSFIKRTNPKTMLSVLASYQERTEYERIAANFSYGYFWKNSEFFTHIFNPFQINLLRMEYHEVQVDTVNMIFDDYLRLFFHYFLAMSNETQLVASSNYSIIFSNQHLTSRRDFFNIRYLVETAGFTANKISEFLKEPQNENGENTFFRIPLVQYLKTEIDFRYYKILNKRNSAAFRVFGGMIFPYGNSKQTPYAIQYFSGGANDVRAWQVRTLGPGSFQDTIGIAFWVGNIKLLTVAEYRSKLFWRLEGAIFLDIGNCWNFESAISVYAKSENKSEYERYYKGVFEANRFYKELAIGTGVGARLDFSFFIFRLDFGLKLRDPSQEESQRWTIIRRGFQFNDFTFNLGIGYPF